MSQPLKETPKHQNRFKSVEVSKQEPSARSKNFNEVVLGYTEEQAQAEASRCLNCPKPLCVEGCPVGVEIPKFIALIKQKDYDAVNQTSQREKQSARYLRQSLPARRAMPKKMHSRQKRRCSFHRTP